MLTRILTCYQRILVDRDVTDDIVDVELEMHRLALAASAEPGKKAENRMSYLCDVTANDVWIDPNILDPW